MAEKVWTASFPDLDKPVWMRVRFYSHHVDPRPMKWPPPGPWWCSGSSEDDKGDIMIIVAYVKDPIMDIADNWPEHGDVEIFEQNVAVEYSERFPKPDWIV